MALPSPLLLLLLLLLLLTHPSQSRLPKHPQPLQQQLQQSSSNEQQQEGGERNCTGRWIHILPLPSRFNTDLLKTCDSFPILTPSFCPYISNHGLGPRTHNRSRSWFRTDPLLLEPLFHRRILEYPCLSPTTSPFTVAVFLPYYSSLAALPYLYSPPLFNSSSLHALDLVDHLRHSHPDLLNRSLSHDLFFVSALPAWDISKDPSSSEPSLWGTSLLHLPDLLNATVLTPEARPSPWQDRAVPYPTSFHPATLARLDSWLARARSSRRSTLALFVGGGGGRGPNVRASIKSQCLNRTDICRLVDCSNGVCAHDPIRYMKPMLISDFCLQPPGDTPTRRSTFDGIIAGCIPVFFEELSARAQYGWHLTKMEYEKFSVFIPKEDVVFNGVNVLEVLEAVPRARVRRMRERVLELAPRVMYRRHGSSEGLREKKDAFDLAIEGVLRRVKRRVRSISEPELLYEDEEDDL